jgi:hypothetical protein
MSANAKGMHVRARTRGLLNARLATSIHERFHGTARPRPRLSQTRFPHRVS